MATITTKERVPYRIWDKVNSKWNELKFKTNANSVDAEDGKTLETKVGVINGITSDLSGEAEDVAASIKCVNQLNSNLGTFSFYHDPNIVHLVADDKVYSVEDNTYVLADSSTGATLLADTDTYYAKTLAGNYCSTGGADTVVPFTADNNSYYESGSRILPDNPDAEETITKSYSFANTTGWQKQGGTAKGTWTGSGSAALILYQDKTIYKADTINVSYQSSHSGQGSGSSSCSGNFYLYGYYNDSNIETIMYGANSGNNTFTIDDSWYQKYDSVVLSYSVEYYANAGYGAYDQYSASYGFTVNITYKKI